MFSINLLFSLHRRYNKNKVTSSVTPSTLRSQSGSDTASIMSQQCLACTDNRLTRSERSLDEPRERCLLDQHRSRSSSRPEHHGDQETMSSYMRRSSAPEIDHESPAEEDLRSRREMYTRSLGRTRRQGFESGRSSDGESSKHDPDELQRARAHLKETLEGKIEKLRKIEAEKQHSQNETKAVVHRSDSQHVSVSGSKTLDSDAIKQYQNIKQNAAAVGAKQQRYSGMFADKNKERLSSSSTNSRTDHPTSRADHQPTPSIYKQNSYDNITSRNTETATLPREKYEGRESILLNNTNY